MLGTKVITISAPAFAIVWCFLAMSAIARTPESHRGAADPALQAPVIRFSAGASHAAGKRIFQGIPTIERTTNGRLWAAWFARSESKWPDDHVLLVTSDDGGKSWSELRLVIDLPGSVCAFDPCLWLDPDGLLWLFWAQSNGRWDGRGGVWCITSEDSQTSAPTWSEPRRLCNGVMLHKPTVLRTGEWLLPVSVWAKPAGPTTAPKHQHYLGHESGANVLVTCDGGSTFAMIGQVRVPQREYDEHHIIERNGGSLWMLLRTPNGIAESESADHGHTWTPGRASPIPNVNSRFCIRRLRSGSLLLVTHEPPDGRSRSHLIARISEDDGKTWQGGLMLDERPGVSYPDAIEDPKGVIRVIYDFERTKAKQILMAQFTEGHVLRGRPARNTRLRVVVNQATGERSKQ